MMHYNCNCDSIIYKKNEIIHACFLKIILEKNHTFSHLVVGRINIPRVHVTIKVLTSIGMQQT
jgi:hypothetical protein